MNRVAFENYLTAYVCPNGVHLAPTAIQHRLRKAEEAEDKLGHSLDVSVATDVQMRKDLMALRNNDAKEVRYGGMQNSLRKYYHMIHGNWFPRLKDV